MVEEKKQPTDKKNFGNQAVKKEARKLKARGKKEVNAWWGFRLFGLVGWSVIVPALIGVFIGLWLEHHYVESHSWTLALMLAGICVGVVLAFVLLAKELFKKEDD